MATTTQKPNTANGLFSNGNIRGTILLLIAIVSTTYAVAMKSERSAIAADQQHAKETIQQVCKKQETVVKTIQDHKTRLCLTEKAIENMNQEIRAGFKDIKTTIKDFHMHDHDK